jgi:CheY-like chemotaxis protein
VARGVKYAGAIAIAAVAVALRWALIPWLGTDTPWVRTCFDGAAAFAAAAQSPPDVAFIDLNMPYPDGIDLARMIRTAPWGSSIRLVALTGMGQPADLERTRAAGFDKHLVKPVAPDDLLDAVAALPPLDGSRAALLPASHIDPI